MIKKRVDGKEIKIKTNTVWYHFVKVIEEMRVGELKSAVQLQDLVTERIRRLNPSLNLPDRSQILNQISRYNNEFARVLVRNGNLYQKVRKGKSLEAFKEKQKEEMKQGTLSFDEGESKRMKRNIQVFGKGFAGPIHLVFESFEELREFVNSQK
jgi:hypothetical protein